MAIAAFLASIGGSIGAFATDNPNIAIVGIVCAALSAAIYNAVEAWVDGKRLESNATSIVTTKTISATSANAKETVEKLLSDTPQTSTQE